MLGNRALLAGISIFAPPEINIFSRHGGRMLKGSWYKMSAEVKSAPQPIVCALSTRYSFLSVEDAGWASKNIPGEQIKL